ncbi:hypothetical protein P171DRAFT_404797 [Karstenula rhodostoma CBS 690.94]|uniref:Uncharacterized protein n=1 Tax=Karstenula rhodostoma CBS 690.94 TaxID=1392251 RepID=A0A9P4PUD5_9PLEO|nr:hypothetical protein P171DRAFT_404797 [Karstenula rhodostoma CBS 690.94]
MYPRHAPQQLAGVNNLWFQIRESTLIIYCEFSPKALLKSIRPPHSISSPSQHSTSKIQPYDSRSSNGPWRRKRLPLVGSILSKMSISTSDVVREAFSLDTFPKFIHLYDHAKSLHRLHGKYTALSDPIIFARATHSTPTYEPPSEEDLAYSFAAAQDAIHTMQPAGPAKDDLQLFKLLWNTAIDVIEKVLGDSNLDLEVYAWGIVGLAAGYMHPETTSLADKEKVAAYQFRLQAALKSLPSLTSPHNDRASGVSPEQRAYMLTKARREVHVCSNLLLQQFRNDGWTGIKWYHGLAVAERWIGNPTFARVVTEEEEEEEEEVQDVLDESV